MPPAPLAFRNGAFVPAAELTLSAADAGFVSGATVTDFCRTYRHRLFRWPDHLARLRRDAAACRVPLPAADADLTAAAAELVRHNAGLIGEQDDLALITFATPGPLGHLLGHAGTGPPTVGMHTFPLPRERYRRFFTEGVTLAVAGPDAESALVPRTAKHRSRLSWWLAQAAVDDPAGPFYCPGAVPVLGAESRAVDTPIGAVFAVAGDTLLRPGYDRVLGSLTARRVEELAGPLGLRVRAGELGAAEVGAASEVVLAGTAFGVAGVRAFVDVGRRREFDWPGPVFRRLQAAWAALTGVDVEGQMTG